MTQTVLDLLSECCQRPFKTLWNEQRVIAKSAITNRLASNSTLATPFKNLPKSRFNASYLHWQQ